MKAFISEDTEKQYILECQDIGEQRIGLYRGIDKYLNIEVNGVSIKTTLVFHQTFGIRLDFLLKMI